MTADHKVGLQRNTLHRLHLGICGLRVLSCGRLLSSLLCVNFNFTLQLWVKSGSAEVRDAGVTTGKKREVSRFLQGYDVVDETYVCTGYNAGV